MRHERHHRKEEHHHLGFIGLEKKVAKEYEGEGVKKATAERWAAGTAANVYREMKGHKCSQHCAHMHHALG